MPEPESSAFDNGSCPFKKTKSFGIWLVLGDDGDSDFSTSCLRILLENPAGFDERKVAVQLSLEHGLMCDCVRPIQVIGHGKIWPIGVDMESAASGS